MDRWCAAYLRKFLAANLAAVEGSVQRAQFSIISGKGSADMAMAMDAVDLLQDGGLVIDGFAMVSSDSDFTPLASKLREEGRHVVGFGRRTTPSPFLNACRAFVHLEDLGSTQPPAMVLIVAGAGEQGSVAALLHTIEQVRIELEKHKAENKKLQQELVEAKSQLSSDNADEAIAGAPEAREATKFTGLLKGLDVDLSEALASCLSDKHSANGWVDISLLANTLRRRKPSWNVRNYGVTKKEGLKGLLELPEVRKLFELQNTRKSASLPREGRAANRCNATANKPCTPTPCTCAFANAATRVALVRLSPRQSSTSARQHTSAQGLELPLTLSAPAPPRLSSLSFSLLAPSSASARTLAKTLFPHYTPSQRHASRGRGGAAP